MEWSVGSINNEASHGLSLSKVELHGFASNATVLLRLKVGLQSPSGDNRIPGWHFALLCSMRYAAIAIAMASPLMSR